MSRMGILFSLLFWGLVGSIDARAQAHSAVFSASTGAGESSEFFSVENFQNSDGSGVPSEKAVPGGVEFLNEFEKWYVHYTNLFRLQNGKHLLKVDRELSQSARGRSKEMFEKWKIKEGALERAHGPTGLTRQHLGFAENISGGGPFIQGQYTVKDFARRIVDGLIKSTKGHREKMLKDEWRYIGAGSAGEIGKGMLFFTQQFTQGFEAEVSAPKGPSRPVTEGAKKSLDLPNEKLVPIKGNVQLTELERWVVYYANEFRLKHGKPLFIADSELTESARKHTQGMLEKFVKSGSNPKDFDHSFHAKEPTGISSHRVLECFAENIGLQSANMLQTLGARECARRMCEGWENSPNHRENLLRDVTYIGVGVVGNSTHNFFTQQFMNFHRE